MFYKTFAPGRICLLGDKIDLLGYPVIASTISTFVHFDFSLSTDGKLHFFNKDSNKSFSRPFDKYENDEFFKFFSQISWRLRDKIQPITCTSYGDLPIGSGLSSSAASSVGFIRGLSNIFGLKMQPYEVAELAYDVEHNDLGVMCGRMDQYSIAVGGVTYIETGDKVKVTPINTRSLPIIIGDSCESRQAKVILNRTKKLLEEKNSNVLHHFNLMHSYVQIGYDAILRNDHNTLGKVMTLQQKSEKAIGASSDRIEAMCSAARKAGAIGAKQMGAGGGGCMLALAPQNPDKVIAAIHKAGGKAWPASLFVYH